MKRSLNISTIISISNPLASIPTSNYQIIDPLKLIIGGRYDQFSGDLTDHLLNDQESSMKNTGIFSPKGGLLLTLLEDRFAMFTNYARGFAMMSGFAEQAQYTQDNWDPQIRTQYELGMRVKPWDWFSGQLVGYRLDTTDDFIQNAVTNEYENVGETTRKGIELTLDFYAFDFGYLHGDFSYIDAVYDKYYSGGVSYDGNDLRGVPNNIANIELGYNPIKGLGGWIRYHYQSGAMLDNANTMKGESGTNSMQMFLIALAIPETTWLPLKYSMFLTKNIRPASRGPVTHRDYR